MHFIHIFVIANNYHNKVRQTASVREIVGVLEMSDKPDLFMCLFLFVVDIIIIGATVSSSSQSSDAMLLVPVYCISCVQNLDPSF